ncbi:Cytosolic carboxypeptidase 2 [Phytophthora boehmeriae]|uniref:Cytosolic carboxypeptidase 2 n=1 Tax=Phytophthora boehmeriae TaxID=109152 RepID=A0A8T1WV93_9STRA|nr:Cytosolic carboxypeptidase 2 [Phytophthora boehmeriae]
MGASNRDCSIPMKPEPILRESRALLENEAEEHEELEILARLHVYEYNQPSVFKNCSAPDDTLVFDSLFESGNLQRAERIFRKTASRVPQQEYEMLIHPDVKNGAYRQWFYFEVRNGRPGTTYRFALINLAKSGALFGQGLQPVVYSEKDAAAKGIGWCHRGTHVRYDVSVSSEAPPGANTLSFQYEFEHENDCVFFACLQPYTYTDLMDYLHQLERDPQRSLTFRRTELCQSLAQNSCDLLTITSPGKDGLPFDERRIIVLSSRVHPGEPNSSWMMQGMLDYLTGSSSGAVVLRQNFIFKVVPMLNPDGVINGNTRVSLAGWDLNRKWCNPIEQLFPTIYHLKRQLAKFQAHDRVAIYCDLHGHSINRNIFMYGCYTKKRPTVADAASTMLNAVPTPNSATRIAAVVTNVKTDPRVFPMIVARYASCFAFENCDFNVHKSKMTTARVVVNQELGVTNSYTLEASFCGSDFGTHKDTQFSTWDLEEMGRAWCKSLLVYYRLTNQVKTLDTESSKNQSLGQPYAVTHAPMYGCFAQPFANNVLPTEDEDSNHARDLLLDCEAAISALFAQSDITNEAEGFGDNDHDVTAVDSDLSGAEEDPIPPSSTLEDEEFAEDVQSERRKQYDDDSEAVVDADGYSSAPEECPSQKNHARKKTARRKPARGSMNSKAKLTGNITGRKGEVKSKKKKKRKKHSNTPATLLVLPSVMNGSGRNLNLLSRPIKSAPGYDKDPPTAEEKMRLSFTRARGELPALHLSIRDEEQQRQARLRQLWKHQHDDPKADEDSDSSSGRSEPEMHAANIQ